jgi:phospholipid transport system substrate-binding protein
MKRWLCFGLYVLVLLLQPAPARANTALETIKGRIEQVLAVLREPSLTGDSTREAKKKKIMPIFDATFDYTELSQRTLSRNWEKLKPEQREEFKKLYKALLEKVYMDTILSYKDQQVVFGKERTLGQTTVEVDSKVVGAGKETPILFRMVSKNGGWWVYDVVIEGISMVTNYRSQFNRILAKDSPDVMLASLRKQVGSQ